MFLVYGVSRWASCIFCVLALATSALAVLPRLLLDSLGLYYAQPSDFLSITPNGDEKPFSPAATRSLLSGWSLALASANIIMQLAQLPIGHGVALSKAGSSIFRSPVKR